METCFVNLVEADDPVLILINGVFGMRMQDVASRLGANVETLEFEWGTPVVPEEVKKAITKKTVGILPVHLYGQSCCMDKLNLLAKKYKLFVIEDCAQSFGARFNQKNVGSWGDCGAFSFFPSKILGGFGDGGCITTSDKKLAEYIAILHLHGQKLSLALRAV